MANLIATFYTMFCCYPLEAGSFFAGNAGAVDLGLKEYEGCAGGVRGETAAGMQYFCEK